MKLRISREQLKAELERARGEGWIAGYTGCLADFLKATKDLSENITARLVASVEEVKGAKGN